ncbi:2-amino-4-hydroxy-6-hydroxymethyldihydropteridinediphosphokinase [Caloranaerobacter azorensis DSM 13643]|uniref:2-amino-4-hydroxy-6-hydroxymethyldihydropteridine diphosphokinase n=1 Tax=Caloranaerobacter azorensis DSM 13643 TaxID=1121264 RepID=A0A1M5W7N6_9FIRM|nr:2-amino-4-hydroxy-6-hydroxymethyldihydropteridine diphosphokinase [Caloranaerobacter azorensis]SHH83497.1 2-amino-4-hydroxy-6-hydroxymethyldihydropteridinediphosphokinase [Caloranaerobacter azorensis DSM 13643]
MAKVYLGVGTNLGDRLNNLNEAIRLIKNFRNTEVIKISKIYETEPWGYTLQDKFLNLCMEIETDLDPFELLEECQKVERILKRKRYFRWGPRTIDVDILIYDDVSINDDKLTIPHPRIQERAFVLVPLKDLNENIVIKGKTISEWIDIVGLEGIKEFTIK